MNNTESKTPTIMFDSNEAATYRTDISGWVSAGGRYWGKDERAARYDGCTHQACLDCGKPTEKSRVRCEPCHDLQQQAYYDAKEYKKWDGKTPLYSEWLNEYIFDDPCEFLDEQVANGGVEGEVGDLRLIICEPKQLSPIEEYYWENDLAEDYDLPNEVIKAMDEFNKVLKDAGTVSWWPGKFRTSVN